MAKETYTVTLADGTQISGLELSGNNFYSKTEITQDMFDGKLSPVVISSDTGTGEPGLLGEHEHMELLQVAHYTKESHGCADGWYFILRDIPETELKEARIWASIDYLAMMSGIEL